MIRGDVVGLGAGGRLHTVDRVEEDGRAWLRCGRLVRPYSSEHPRGAALAGPRDTREPCSQCTTQEDA